jgi:hypothetical protein
MRLAALSNAKLEPWINWSTLGPPLLHPLAAYPGSQLIAPPPLRWEHRRQWRAAIRHCRQADTMFWMQGSARPEAPLMTLSATRPGVRRSAFVIDAWRPGLTKIGMLAVAQRLDPCFVAFREGCQELTSRFPRGRFEWLPFGVDTEVFRPGDGERDIFAFWMGRRSARLHNALLRYCGSRGLHYRYTLRPGEFRDPGELGTLAGRCRYFIVTPPDLDNPVRTGGYSPLVMRYLEGLAAGARLLGVRPGSGEFEELIPHGALCEVKADGSDLAAILDADQQDAGAWQAVSKACDLVRAEHSWSRRAQQVFERLSAG